MIYIELINLSLIVVLCYLSTKSDLSSGLIHNQTLLIFLFLSLCLNAIYYGFFVKDLFGDYLVNLLIIITVSAFLFYSHSFAGGDCKLCIVLAMLYPARLYVVYGTTNVTLVLAICFAICFGYCYLLITSVYSILVGRVGINLKYIKDSIYTFAKSFFVAALYISLINTLCALLINRGLQVNSWCMRLLCLFIAWCIGKIHWLRKPAVIILIIVIVAVFSAKLKMLPFSLNLEHYTLVLAMLFCQMSIKTVIYETVEINALKKGMILSTMASVLMQSSITKGLPGISSENLSSRLSDSEVESIRIWAKATHVDSLTIVKKIPFAIFISIGFASYYLLWSIL